jgi:pimeloyl-ACP methyl ester carboxylesterase
MPVLKLDDADIYYEATGKGPAFLFCSATSTSGDVWKFYQVPEFSRDHTVITYDQRGVGKSPARSKDFSVARLAADAAALLKHVDRGPAVVLGHSNGGRIAQSLALDYPDLVSYLILASSGGTHSSENGIPISICMDLVEKGYERSLREHAIEAGFTKTYVAAHAQDVERFLAVRCANPPPVEIYLRHVIGRQEFDSKGRLKTLKVPTLVLIGDDEGHGRAGLATHLTFAESLAAEIPGARLVVLPGQGHHYYFSDPVGTNRAIRDFLSASGRRAGR